MTLVYAAIPEGYNFTPSWVQALLDMEVGQVVYVPTYTYEEVDRVNEGKFLPLLGEEDPEIIHSILGFSKEIAKSYTAVDQRFFSSPLVSSVVFQDLYVLVRADVVVVDGNNPSFGDVGQVALYAKLLGIPVILVSDLVTTSPWLSTVSTVTSSGEGLPNVLKRFLVAPRAKKEVSQPSAEDQMKVTQELLEKQAAESSEAVAQQSAEVLKQAFGSGAVVTVGSKMAEAAKSLHGYLRALEIGPYVSGAMSVDDNCLVAVVQKEPTNISDKNALDSLAREGFQGHKVDVRHLWKPQEPQI